jgi:hypothetical protein
MPALALLFSLATQAPAAISAASPAMQQLTALEGERPDAAPTPEGAVSRGNLGFTVQSLQPVGYLDDRGQAQEPPPQETAPLPPRGKTYIFEGSSKIPGVKIYSPKEDPTGDGRTVAPKEGLGGGLLMYGGIGAAAGLALVFTSVNPFIILAVTVVAVLAALFFFNRKSA